MDLPTEAEPVKVVEGDCLDVLRAMPDGCVDAVVTDPPYGLEFMGKEWDSIGGGRVAVPGVGDREAPWVSQPGWNCHRCVKCGHLSHGGSPCECPDPDIRPVDNRWQRMQEWYREHFAAVLRVIKPGGYAVVFGGSRTYHRLTCAVEDAGFEVRDCLLWLYGTGFPKGKGCLKPAYEPVLLCRRPGPKVLPLGIDECRVATEETTRRTNASVMRWSGGWTGDGGEYQTGSDAGRWPANVLHDGSGEVLEAFAAFGEKTSGTGAVKRKSSADQAGNRGFAYGAESRPSGTPMICYGDSGSVARFFYCAKASKSERGEGNTHPTVKPVAVMRWLARLVCPPGGLILDPFAGSGTTGAAAREEGRLAVLVERQPEYAAIIRRRLAPAAGQTLFG